MPAGEEFRKAVREEQARQAKARRTRRARRPARGLPDQAGMVRKPPPPSGTSTREGT